MSNPLFAALGGRTSSPVQDGGFSQMVQQLQQFRNTFRGDPRAEVQRLLQSGQMTQAQFNQYGQMASQLMQLMR